MEQSASTLGTRHAIPEIVVGGLILAGVTSLPNAVAAIYLAGRGRGAATLSTAMNSNALNITIGLRLPGAIIGLGEPSRSSTFVAAWYLGITLFALGFAFSDRGLRRGHGVLIIAAHLTFVGLLLGSAESTSSGMLLGIAVPAVLGIGLGVLVAMLARRLRQPADGRVPVGEAEDG
jgi:Ca2+/Na+ antiporter